MDEGARAASAPPRRHRRGRRGATWPTLSCGWNSILLQTVGCRQWRKDQEKSYAEGSPWWNDKCGREEGWTRDTSDASALSARNPFWEHMGAFMTETSYSTVSTSSVVQSNIPLKYATSSRITSIYRGLKLSKLCLPRYAMNIPSGLRRRVPCTGTIHTALAALSHSFLTRLLLSRSLLGQEWIGSNGGTNITQ